MTEADRIIRERRSIYPDQFTEQEIGRKVIEEILESAISAPTHKKTEPWRFKVYRNDALFGLGEFLKGDFLRNAKQPSQFKASKKFEKVLRSNAIIMIIMHRDPEERLPEWEEIAAVSAAVQNLWISAINHGLGGYWSSPSALERISTFANLKENERCLGLFYLGHHNQEGGEKVRKPLDEVVEWIG